MTTTSVSPATQADAPASRGGARVRVQKFGTFLSNMVMPNIGAFIAWGFITALFIEVGWLPHFGIGDSPDSWVAQIGGWGDFAAPDGSPVAAGIVGSMIKYLLPLLIGYTGGYNMYKQRGGVVGAIATFGVIAGTEIPMFMGAMIMGPLGGWTMKKIDALWDGKIRPGFEMLVNNFSAGIWGMVLAIFGFFVMSPIVTWIADRLGEGVDFLVGNNLLPFTSVIIEPAKVLFLNNALNHGVLTPLGLDQAAENGKSVLFLLEANPAGGLGLLLAFMFFGKGTAKASAPGAAIIHFFGGIHEIYFPYVLMKPKLILAMIAGGMTQIFVNVIFSSGLVAPAAPGSIFAIYANTARGSYLGVTLSVVLGGLATFLVAALLLKTDKAEEDGDLAAATADMEAMKGKKSSVSTALVGAGAAGAATGPITSIVFACDAGMGSSAMGASVLRKKVHSAGFGEVSVTNKAIANLTDDVDLVVSHQDLTDRARRGAPSAQHVSVDNFMGSPRYDEIVEAVRQRNSGGGNSGGGNSGGGNSGGDSAPSAVPAVTDAAAEPAVAGEPTDVLAVDSIVLGGSATSRDDAITEAGDLLVAAGAVEQSYVAAMHERETSVSTHMGNLLAIPHGTNEAKPSIKRTALSYVHYPQTIDWNGKPAEFVIGIAGAGTDHLKLLAKIAGIFTDAEQVERLRAARSAEDVLAVLDSVRV